MPIMTRSIRIPLTGNNTEFINFNLDCPFLCKKLVFRCTGNVSSTIATNIIATSPLIDGNCVFSLIPTYLDTVANPDLYYYYGDICDEIVYEFNSPKSVQGAQQLTVFGPSSFVGQVFLQVEMSN